MELVIPKPAMDFNFDSACSSPYISAPSSPKRFGEFFSAPTSPTRISAFYSDFNNFNTSNSPSVIPFNWEEKPGRPKSFDLRNEEDEFEFDFRGVLERGFSLTADELFDGGKIRPLKPPPRLQINGGSSPKSPKSPISQGKKIVREAFSPRKTRDFDPFAIAASIEQNRSGSEQEQERGRERISSSFSSNSSRRGTRSLSPYRDSEIDCEEKQSTKPSSLNSKPISSSSSSSSVKNSRKWRLKDFLLFRSASEGRASDKDSLRKYSGLSRKIEDVKNASFRSTESSGSVSSTVSGSMRRGRVSAHELHYTVNRAVSEQMKRKTFLPYKQGLLGCLGFNPAVNGLTKGFGSLAHG